MKEAGDSWWRKRRQGEGERSVAGGSGWCRSGSRAEVGGGWGRERRGGDTRCKSEANEGLTGRQARGAKERRITRGKETEVPCRPSLSPRPLGRHKSRRIGRDDARNRAIMRGSATVSTGGRVAGRASTGSGISKRRRRGFANRMASLGGNEAQVRPFAWRFEQQFATRPH